LSGRRRKTAVDNRGWRCTSKGYPGWQFCAAAVPASRTLGAGFRVPTGGSARGRMKPGFRPPRRKCPAEDKVVSKRRGWILGALARSRSFSSRPDGPPHWQFREAEEPSKGSPAPPRIGAAWRSATPRSATTTWAANGTSPPSLRALRAASDLKLNATGKLQGEQLELEITRANGAARSPGSPAERGLSAPYAIEARIEAGQTKIAASGDISSRTSFRTSRSDSS
jgi:hypothetical protein